MRVPTWTLTVLVMGCAPVSGIAAEADRSSSAVRAALKDLLELRGEAYVQAREAFLRRDHQAVAEALKAEFAVPGSACRRLVVQALRIRHRKPGSLDVAMTEGFEAAGRGSTTAETDFGRRLRRAPNPTEGALILIKHAGRETVPLTAEVLTRGLLAEAVPWKRHLFVQALAVLGRARRSDGRVTPAYLPEAADVLIWVLAHSEDGRALALSAQAIRRYASTSVLDQLRNARSQFGHDAPEAQRLALAEAIDGVAAELRILSRTRPARTQPAIVEPKPER